MTALLDYAVLWPVLVPLAAAALCMLCWQAPKAQAWVQGGALLAMLAVALMLLTQVRVHDVVAVTLGGWAPPFGISFVADRFGAAMVLVSAVLALAAGVFGLATTHARQVRNGLYPLLLAMLAAVNGAFLAGDVFNLYVWFEILLISALGLMVLDQSRAQLDAAVQYAVLNLLGTLVFLLAIALLYGVTGTLNMADLAQVLPHIPASPALAVSAALFLVGFGIKAGFFPMFFWLPASYHAVPIAVLALFAGLLTKVGVFACYRIFSLLFEHGAALREVMAWLAAGTMVFGVFGAAVQWDLRRILSFHIISQIGYILLGLALGTAAGLAGGIFYTLHHIIVKANLFLVAGAIYRVSGSYDLRRIGGLARSQPLLALLFAIPALSLAGVPPLSGFWAKLLIVTASLRAEAYWLAATALLVGLLTVFSMSKIWIEAFWKPAPVVRGHRRVLPASMVLPIAGLAAITLWIGLQPEALLQFSRAAAQTLLDSQPYIQTTFSEVAEPAMPDAQEVP